MEETLQRERIKLKNGHLDIVHLNRGGLILGEISIGFATENDVRLGLKKAGYKYGIILENLSLIAHGYKGQVPLATSIIAEKPPGTEDLFLNTVNNYLSQDYSKILSFNSVPGITSVKKEEILKKVIHPRTIVSRNPDGKEKLLHEDPHFTAWFFGGKNTNVDKDGRIIRAAINGYAHQSLFGVVSVFPEQKVRSIGAMSGKIRLEKTIIVEQDVMSKSFIEVPSSLQVNGMIKSSYVDVEGDIQAKFGIINPINYDDAKLIAGQSIFTKVLGNYEIWAGSNMFISEKISSCNVDCLDTLVALNVHASKLNIGNKLIVGNITGDSTIQLGSDFVKTPEVDIKKSKLLQHRRRMNDIEVFLNQKIYELNKNCKNAESIKDTTQRSRMQIIRFTQNVRQTLDLLREKTDQYLSTGLEVAQESMVLAYYEDLIKSFDRPQMIVLNKLNPGTKIFGPADKLTVDKPYSRVMVSIDKITNFLKITPLDEISN